MIANQPPLADVLADLGQWLQQWATFIQAQIEIQPTQPTEEDGLPLAALDESDTMMAGQTAVPREASSPPAHWLALFAEQGERSLEEAAADAETATLPVEFEVGQVDTAVLTDWITQLHDGLFAFREQVDPQFSPEQAEYMAKANAVDVVPFVPSIDNDENGQGDDEVPLTATSAEQKTSLKQAIPQPYPEERAEIEKKRPLLSPTFSPARPSPLAGNTGPEMPSADAQTIQRKVDPASEPLVMKEHLSLETAFSLSPVLPDERRVDGRDPNPDSSSLSHRQQPQFVSAATETKVERPQLPLPTPMNVPEAATVLSQSPHTIKRVTRLRLNPLPQRESSTAQMTPTIATPPPDSNPIGSTVLENGFPSNQVTRQPVVEGLAAAPVEKTPSMTGENRLDTAVSPTAAQPMGKVLPLAAKSRLDTAVSTSPTPDFPPLPPEKSARKGKTGRAINGGPTNRAQPSIVQAAAAPPTKRLASDWSQRQAPYPPMVDSGQVRDGGEAERPLPSEPIKQVHPLSVAENPSELAIWPGEKPPSLKPELAVGEEAERPFPPQKHPDYQIPPPPGPRQPPQWSVTPENRWPALPSLPTPDPNPALAWRHQPVRRQRLDREQQGTSWNESFS